MNINEVQFLQKMFKYFDIQNRGRVNFDQFYRAMEKTGIIMEKSVSNTALSYVIICLFFINTSGFV